MFSSLASKLADEEGEGEGEEEENPFNPFNPFAASGDEAAGEIGGAEEGGAEAAGVWNNFFSAGIAYM